MSSGAQRARTSIRQSRALRSRSCWDRCRWITTERNSRPSRSSLGAMEPGRSVSSPIARRYCCNGRPPGSRRCATCVSRRGAASTAGAGRRSWSCACNAGRSASARMAASFGRPISPRTARRLPRRRGSTPFAGRGRRRLSGCTRWSTMQGPTPPRASRRCEHGRSRRRYPFAGSPVRLALR